MKNESNKNWTTCLRLNTGDGSPRVFLYNSHFLGSVPNQLYICIKKVPPHAERSTNMFILTVKADSVNSPIPTIPHQQTPKKALTCAPILAITNFRKTRLFLTHFDLWRFKKHRSPYKKYE